MSNFQFAQDGQIFRRRDLNIYHVLTRIDLMSDGTVCFVLEKEDKTTENEKSCVITGRDLSANWVRVVGRAPLM